MSGGERFDLEEALAGHEPDLSNLIEHLLPILRACTLRVVQLRSAPSGPRNVREETQDLVQEILLQIIKDDWKVLRSWRVERGLSLESFVGLVTDRRVHSILRTKKHNPWTEDPVADADLDRSTGKVDPESITASRELQTRILEDLREKTTALGWRMFELLYLRQLAVQAVTTETGMKRASVYKWRHRLKRQVQEIVCQL